LLILPVLLLAAAAAALRVDCLLAQWCVDKKCPGEFRRLFGIAEPFGNGYGVVAVALAIYLLDPARRRKLGRFLAMSFGAGMAANGLKLLVARWRPHKFDFSGTLQDTFIQWLPMGAGGSARQSFPSAHTATAVGLAIALAWLYPRGRRLFAGLAVLVACQRVASGAHYLSDTLVGMSVGWVAAMPFLHNAWLAAQFDRLEGRAIRLRHGASSSLRSAPSVPMTFKADADKDRSRAA
jgi:membrane-associated phospholipid phosphatase